MDKDLLKIIEHYGVLPQLKYFQSEVFELTEAILNRDINWNYDTEIQDIKPLDEHIAEEIADVEVMLLQFKEYYHIDGKDILEIMERKIKRQLERIKKEQGE